MRLLRRFNSLGLLGLLLTLLAIPTSAQQSATQQAAVDHLQPIRWMAGKTWTADAVSPSGKKSHVESVVSVSPNGNNIQFTVSFDGKPHYDGFYTWDPASKQIHFWYTSSEGELTQGTVEQNGQELLHIFTIADTDGRVASLRSHVVPVSADAYEWNVETQRDGKWVELIHLHYTRKA